MKAISKQHVIELLNKIQVTGLDNSRYSVDEFKSPVIAEKWYGKPPGVRKYSRAHIVLCGLMKQTAQTNLSSHTG